MFININLACTSHLMFSKTKKVMWQLPLTNYTFHPFNAGLHNQSHANINFLFNNIKGSVFLINRNIRYEQFPSGYTYQISLIATVKGELKAIYIPQLEDLDSIEVPKPELKPLLEGVLVPAAQPRLAELGLL